MNNEVDINVLVTLYNQRLATLTNQNILLEAKIQSIVKTFEIEKEQLLAQLLELRGREDSSPKSRASKKSEDYQNSEVE